MTDQVGMIVEGIEREADVVGRDGNRGRDGIDLGPAEVGVVDTAESGFANHASSEIDACAARIGPIGDVGGESTTAAAKVDEVITALDPCQVDEGVELLGVEQLLKTEVVPLQLGP